MLRVVVQARRQSSERGIVLTASQRFWSAWIWVCVGAVIGSLLVAGGQRLAPVPPVELLDPLIEHTSDGYSVYRLRMRWRGAEKSCELFVFHDRLTWRLTCEPR
jgi:hypothetical protein